ncbi:MAG: hypothetical protein IOC98_14125, partial [Rhodobacter sp.]|nr:hypothetical protein [Rhodobacter sp.]
MLAWDWDVGHIRLRLISVYAPASDPASRQAFFEDLRLYLSPDRVNLVGGDFNCALEARDRAAAPGGAPAASSGSVGIAAGPPASDAPVMRADAVALRSMMDDHGLVDPWWRHHSARDACFTHPATPKPCRPARLDRWLISSEALPWVRAVRLVPVPVSDHLGVALDLLLPGLPHLGRAGWRLPVHLLYNPVLRGQLEESLAAVLATTQDASAVARWDRIKEQVQVVADALHRRHLWTSRSAVAAALQAAEAAMEQQAQRPHCVATRLLAQDLAVGARRAMAERTRASLDAQGAVYEQAGECSTKFFFALAKQVQPREHIMALAVPGAPAPVPLVGPAALPTISAAAQAHFSSDSPAGLFRVGVVDAAAQAVLLDGLDRTLPGSLRDSTDALGQGGRMTEVELRAALGQCQNGKAPGLDGLPYEVYKVFWALLGGPLLAAANAAFDLVSAAPGGNGADAAQCLPPSWREGVITLLYKGKALPREQLGSYRPITLLNADYKLLGKALSNRLQPALDYLISPLQTAFVAGRDVRENVLFHQGLLDSLERTQRPGALILLDIEKAYDRVHRPWVLQVAAAMGFGGHALSWLRLFLADGVASVLVNGHRSATFPVCNGLQQGGTPSPVLWALQLEPLTAHLLRQSDPQRQGLFRTPVLCDGSPCPPVSHHADDTNLVVEDLQRDGPVALESVQLFCKASNAQVNASKSRGLLLGSHAQPAAGETAEERNAAGAVVGLRHLATGVLLALPGADPPKHLGVPLTTDLQTAARICFDGRLGCIKAAARRWGTLDLSLAGRAFVAKQVMGNSLVYHLSFVPPTPPQLVSLRRALEHYVAWSRLPEDATLVQRGHAHLLPKALIASLTREEGGVGHVDLPSVSASLLAKVVVQLTQPGRQDWKRGLRAMLACHKPAGTTGWGWVVGTAPVPPSLPARLRCLVDAYRATRPERLPLDLDQHDVRALAAEPLFYNAVVLDPSTRLPLQPPAAGSPWATLGELFSAPAAAQLQAEWQACAAAVPSAWQPLLRGHASGAETPPTPPWRVSPDLQWLADHSGRLWQATASGRLVVPTPGAAAPAGPSPAWLPACVLACRKKRALWSLDEIMAYDSAAPRDKPSLWPVEPHLLGPWASLQCYPPLHGHGGLSLVHYEVSEVRRRLTSLTAAATCSVPVTPAVWRPAAAAAGSGAGPSTAAPATSWLEVAERGWAASVTATHTAQRSAYQPLPPLWLQTSTQGALDRQQRYEARCQARQPRAGPASPGAAPQSSGSTLSLGSVSPGPGGHGVRPAAEVGAAELPGSPPPARPPAVGCPAAARAMWRRLWDCPASNREKSFAWRLAHGRLACGQYLAAKLGPGRGASCSRHLCQMPSCAAVRSGRPQASISHILLQCPAFEEARAWLAELWVQVAGGSPPPTGSLPLMLGDADDGWADHPCRQPGGLHKLWSALRLVFLHCLWSCYTTQEWRGSPSATVAGAVVAALRRRIRSHFAMAAMPPALLNALPRHLFTAQLRPAALDDFESVWAHGQVLCTVERVDVATPDPPDAAAAAPPPPPQLRLRLFLTEQHPVPVPRVAQGHVVGGGSQDTVGTAVQLSPGPSSPSTVGTTVGSGAAGSSGGRHTGPAPSADGLAAASSVAAAGDAGPPGALLVRDPPAAVMGQPWQPVLGAARDRLRADEASSAAPPPAAAAGGCALDGGQHRPPPSTRQVAASAAAAGVSAGALGQDKVQASLAAAGGPAPPDLVAATEPGSAHAAPSVAPAPAAAGGGGGSSGGGRPRPPPRNRQVAASAAAADDSTGALGQDKVRESPAAAAGWPGRLVFEGLLARPRADAESSAAPPSAVAVGACAPGGGQQGTLPRGRQVAASAAAAAT